MTEVVCALIRDDQGRVLAAQRAPGRTLAGKWEFPGGKVEPGESAERALQREIREELGCEIEVGSALPEVLHAYPRGVIELRPFLARVVGGTPRAHEHTALAWVTLDQAAAIDWAEADRSVLAGLSRDAGSDILTRSGE